jgi:hypothetical protein
MVVVLALDIVALGSRGHVQWSGRGACVKSAKRRAHCGFTSTEAAYSSVAPNNGLSRNPANYPTERAAAHRGVLSKFSTKRTVIHSQSGQLFAEILQK